MDSLSLILIGVKWKMTGAQTIDKKRFHNTRKAKHQMCRVVVTVAHNIIIILNYQAFDIFEAWKFSQDIWGFIFVQDHIATILKRHLHLLLDGGLISGMPHEGHGFPALLFTQRHLRIK